MNDLQLYKHQVPIQIRFTDIDRVNHVNNACYHTYIELGRVHYLNEVLHRDVDWETRGFVLVRAEIDHIAQIYLRDEVSCYTRIEKLGNKSLIISSRIVKKDKENLVICAACKGVLVAMDYERNESIVIPETWRDHISAFEGIDRVSK